MSVYQRNKIALSARLCIKCHDPTYVHQKNDPNHKCPITTQKKSRWELSGSHLDLCTAQGEKPKTFGGL